MDDGRNPRTRGRSRLLLGGGIATLLVAGLLAVLLVGGGAGEGAIAADAECVDAWNEDPEALELGRHQLGFHGYTQVQVVRVSSEGVPVAAGEAGGLCAVAFAGSQLDSEYGAAVRVLEGGYWRSLEAIAVVTPDQLAELQAQAQAQPNASLADDGRLTPL